MFFERKIKLSDSDFFKGFTDYHSHILFGVDDGIKELTESLDILEYYESLGVKRVILTPHVNEMYRNADLIEKNYETLCSVYSGDIQINLASEYMLDSCFFTELSKGLRTINQNRVLVESSYLRESINFDEGLYRITNSGVTPIIAHPERYLFMSDSKYSKLKNCDYLFQLNILSLAGCYGAEVKKRALKLLKNDMYDMIGSDLHNLSIFQQSVAKIKLRKSQIKKLIGLTKNKF